jgi:uncharacterized protein (TIGR02284 family)
MPIQTPKKQNRSLLILLEPIKTLSVGKASPTLNKGEDLMSNQENKTLRKLININEDAAEFYESAQEKAETLAFKTTFARLENLHKMVIVNLQNTVRANGGDPEADETFVGQTVKFWGELMANISNDVNETLVTHLEEAEDRCIHSIKDAMKSDDISPATKAFLQSELTTLQRSHDYMKELKDTLKAA